MCDSKDFYEIRTLSDAEGGLRFGLFVENNQIAIASASSDILDDIQAQLGKSREDVAANLKVALKQILTSQLEKVTISSPVEDNQRPMRFRSVYTYRDHDKILSGLVWYDVGISTTGPEELPALIRNKMRFVVHQMLTSELHAKDDDGQGSGGTEI